MMKDERTVEERIAAIRRMMDMIAELEVVRVENVERALQLCRWLGELKLHAGDKSNEITFRVSFLHDESCGCPD
jgi:hypothetical protein